METGKISTWKVAAAYIGTVVGAGFASGQEILQFFAVFKSRGLYGLVIATILFIVFGYIIMDLGMSLGSKSHLEIIRHTSGKYVGGVIDAIITFFLFGALTAMIAGSGALVNQQFGISSLWGNIIMVFATVVTVLSGTTGVINSISVIVPFLLTSAVGVSIFTIVFMPAKPEASFTAVSSELIQGWFWAAILYISYNMVLAIAVLGPLGKNAKSKKAVKNGAIFGGLGLGLGAIAIYFAISGNIIDLTNVEVPMIYIAGRISMAIQVVYAIVLIAEIYTTAVGSLYGFTVRITDVNSKKAPYIIAGTALIAFAASQFGFSNLVKYLYPIVGYGGLILLASLLYSRFKSA